MANSHTTKSRFLRLYLLCTLVILIWLPLEVIILVRNKPKELVSFAWNSTHHPTEYPWSTILHVPSKGEIPFDRWLWLVGGAAIFAFFGWGRDAVKTYRDGLKKVGLEKLWPKTTISRGASTIGGGPNTVTSKAKLLIEHGKRKMSFASTSTSSTSNNTSTSHPSPNPNISAPTSPTKPSFLPTITETTTSPHRTRPRPDFTLAALSPRRPHVSSPHLYRNPSTARHHRESSWYSALVPTFLTRHSKPTAYDRQDSMTNDPFVLGQMSGNRDGQRSMMLSRVVAEPASPTTKRWMELEAERGGGERVSVKKEFRVGSESV